MIDYAEKLIILKKDIGIRLLKEQQLRQNLECMHSEVSDTQFKSRFQQQRAQSFRHTYRLEAMLALLDHPMAREDESLLRSIVDHVSDNLKMIIAKRSYPIRNCTLWKQENNKPIYVWATA